MFSSAVEAVCGTKDALFHSRRKGAEKGAAKDVWKTAKDVEQYQLYERKVHWGSAAPPQGGTRVQGAISMELNVWR